MSQRLHIGKTTETHYDCVVEQKEGARPKMESEWLEMASGSISGPWVIKIGDVGLFREIEHQIDEMLNDIGKSYPEDVLGFCRQGAEHISQPTREELLGWLGTA